MAWEMASAKEGALFLAAACPSTWRAHSGYGLGLLFPSAGIPNEAESASVLGLLSHILFMQEVFGGPDAYMILESLC